MDPESRERYIPHRSASVTVPDLGVCYAAHVSPGGVKDLREVDEEEAQDAQVRFIANSDVLVSIGRRPAGFAQAWLRGRVTVRAGWRDLLELRALL